MAAAGGVMASWMAAAVPMARRSRQIGQKQLRSKPAPSGQRR